jgi:hypothetical protein
MSTFDQQAKDLMNRLFKKKVSEFHRDPYGDWRRIVIVATIAAVLVIAGDMYFFQKLNRGELFNYQSAASPESVQVFDKHLLTLDNNYYAKLQATFADLSSTTTIPVVDPSR